MRQSPALAASEHPMVACGASPPGVILWCYSCEASLLGSRQMRWALAQQLQSLGGGERERQALLLGVTELVTNTVRHSSPSAAILRVVIWQQGEERWLEIRDDGAPFDPVLHGLLAQRITAPSRGMRDQGYGLLLVANLLPALSYRRLAEVNCYRLPLVA